MMYFDLGQVLTQREQAGRAYLEFLRVASLSMGVYHLKAGQADLQQPHTEDEVYFVVGGRARFRAAQEVRSVEAGAMLFVEKAVEHRFFDVTEDLTLLVFFAPAEGSLQGGKAGPL
jgi:mannose-6-phosphate isomerase-like protein (cupin superfamily)